MSRFCPNLWPEEPVPLPCQNCEDCGLYEHGSGMVWGEGNPNAPIFVLLDNPGAREDREGNEFVCGTRQTLQHAAFEVGLKMEDLYVTYILKRRPMRAYEKEEVRQICMQHLWDQLTEKNPKLILCLGNTAVQAFFRDPSAEVKSLRCKWHAIQGFETAVAYHPLAIRRRPNLRPSYLEDWRLVSERYFSQGYVQR